MSEMVIRPNFDARMTLIGQHLVAPLLAMYTAPEHFAGDANRARMFQNELGAAVNRELPVEMTAGEIEHVLSDAKQRLFSGYKGRIWPTIGSVAGEVREIAVEWRERTRRARIAEERPQEQLTWRQESRFDGWTLESARKRYKMVADALREEPNHPARNLWLHLLAITEHAGKQAKAREEGARSS